MNKMMCAQIITKTSSMLGTMVLLMMSAGGVAEEIEMMPAELAKPLVFASEPNEFSGKPDCRDVSFAIDGAALFGSADFGENAGIQVSIRATQPDTEAVEITLHQKDGKVWGISRLPIFPEWSDIMIPLTDIWYFKHWGLPPIADDVKPDMKQFTKVRFCFGRFLCAGTVYKAHGFEVRSVKMVKMAPGAFGDGRDHSLEEFPRLAEETDDTARLQRAINATPGGVLNIPRGVYEIAEPLRVTNNCSFELNKKAILKAMKPMSCMISVAASQRQRLRNDYGLFFRGGVLDGDGLASCLTVKGFAHYTLADTTFLNGREHGLRVDGGYEIIANNLYFKCLKSGLAGNSAVVVNGGDSHYTDCIVVDYTIGFNILRGGSNRLTRCHVWGGPVPPPKPGELPEMLKDSVNFRIVEGSHTILRDCYADSGQTGYEISGWDTRLLGCSYFNNKIFGLDHITIIKHTRGRLLVSEGGFIKTVPDVKVYEGCGTVEWYNMMYSGFSDKDECPGALSFRKDKPVAQPALNLAD